MTPSRTIPSAADVANLRALPDYERRVSLMREVRDATRRYAAIVGARIDAGDREPEVLEAYEYSLESIAMLEAELAQWGVNSA